MAVTPSYPNFLEGLHRDTLESRNGDREISWETTGKRISAEVAFIYGTVASLVNTVACAIFIISHAISTDADFKFSSLSPVLDHALGVWKFAYAALTNPWKENITPDEHLLGLL